MTPSQIFWGFSLYCGLRWTGQLPLVLPYAISLSYQSKPLIISVSWYATKLTTLWLCCCKVLITGQAMGIHTVLAYSTYNHNMKFPSTHCYLIVLFVQVINVGGECWHWHSSLNYKCLIWEKVNKFTDNVYLYINCYENHHSNQACMNMIIASLAMTTPGVEGCVAQ